MGRPAAHRETGRFDTSGGVGLRTAAARGTLVNAAYQVFLSGLGFIKGFGVAIFLSAEEYGVWGLLAVTLIGLLTLAQVGVDDKYVQQDDEDQVAAFQVAFTMQLALSTVFAVIVVLAVPLYAALYGEWKILLPGWVLALSLPAIALQAPLWAFYRRMDFIQQRKLQSFDPIVSLVVTFALAAAGAGYWSLVVGAVAGSWAAAVAALLASPYPLRLRYRRGTLGEYTSFSGPLLLSAVCALLIAQVPVVIAQRTLGLAAVGAIAIASTIGAYANRVDDIVTETLYPAVCAVRDRMPLLKETFLKSNRLALLWAMPIGVGAVLFAPDLVRYVFGERWEEATFAIQAFALTAALNQVGFNWTAFFRALGRTRPIALASFVMLAAVLALAVPLLLLEGVDGFAVGMGLAALTLIGTRLAYLAPLFGLADILRNSVRGMLPVLPGLVAVLLARAALGDGRSASQAAAEVILFLAATAATTLLSERTLLGEFRGYLRRREGRVAAAAS